MDTKSRIKELMDERGWTIYELAKRSGLAQTTISNMWKRNTEPTTPSLRTICNGFSTTLSQFFAEGDMVELTPEQRACRLFRRYTLIQFRHEFLHIHLHHLSLRHAVCSYSSLYRSAMCIRPASILLNAVAREMPSS